MVSEIREKDNIFLFRVFIAVPSFSVTLSSILIVEAAYRFGRKPSGLGTLLLDLDKVGFT